MSFWPYLAWVLMLNREYCAVARYSVRWPAGFVLEPLNGMVQKVVAATLPVLVVRKTFSKSTNPPGVKSASPILKDSGDSFFCSCPIRLGAGDTTPAGVVVCRAASMIRGVPLVASADTSCFAACCFSRSISCCCRAICFCWSARASRRAFSSLATVELSVLESGFGALAWARINPGARSTRQIVVRILMGTLLRSLSRVFRFPWKSRASSQPPPVRDSRVYTSTAHEWQVNILWQAVRGPSTRYAEGKAFRRETLVRKEGVEPPRPCGHRILSPARLPVPPLPHSGHPADYTSVVLLWCVLSACLTCSTMQTYMSARSCTFQ